MTKQKTNQQTFVFDVYADGRINGIVVAESLDLALSTARKSLTRRTVSKMDSSCDFTEVRVQMRESNETAQIALYTALAAEKKCVPFGNVDVPDIGRIKFVANRYPYVGAPLEISIVTSVAGSLEEFNQLTKAYPRDSKADIANDEIIVKAYSENEVLRSPLLESGYFADTGKRIQLAFNELEVWRLLPEYLNAFREKNKHWGKFVPG
jgi:hypothetical protein